MKNLDFLCMQAAQAMTAVTGDKNAKENLATKALGVLLENGPYGMILYLEVQKKERTIARAYRDQLLALAGLAVVNPTPPNNPDFPKVTEWLQKAAGDLDTYLFVKRLWQQALTYARYHAKAIE
jgi:hypothetical protein